MTDHPSRVPSRGGGARARLAREARSHAPRMYAIAYEAADGGGGGIAAYGLQFADRAETVGVADGHRSSSETAAHARALYARFGAPDDLTAHLVWLDATAPVRPAPARRPRTARRR
ncbi:hypothetical protein [Actinosynnema mirum]|uniref:Uncharacterized protein n=1 Tax=Actinosynnema mirum (strain ATCC 29888 / DSM 43827 / JCM 3225 / NBRC 14064 / NCIMB 13271 / NRRL B-12336 / IMRU 3971 / 101) TaxID=446462 RepID=C6WGR8_ACTMD|nr:hypothetical protein [Actinosynnema mirum]ACU34384.1 hypothetical protein Amir_0417 [Actinosynnema mirum DSM 43827]